MKTKILVTLVFAASSLYVTAQSNQKITSGIIAGASTGSIVISGVNSHVINHIQGDHIFGMEAGAFSRININPFYVKPAAIILYRSGTVDVFNLEGIAYSKSDFKMTRLEIPLQFGINVIGPLNAEIGPVYNHVLGVTTLYNGYSVNVPRNGVGYRAGANIDLDQLALGISYQSIKNMSTTQGTFDSPDEIILTAAYTFHCKPGMAPYGR